MTGGLLPHRPRPERVVGVDQFVDDDAGYEAWLRKHPAGFVVNAWRVPDSSYLKLHRASCATINGRPTNGESWTTTTSKTCATTIAVLDAWARGVAGEVPDRCGSCQP